MALEPARGFPFGVVGGAWWVTPRRAAHFVPSVLMASTTRLGAANSSVRKAFCSKLMAWRYPGQPNKAADAYTACVKKKLKNRGYNRLRFSGLKRRSRR